MNYDKVMYIFYSVIIIILILCISIFSNYGYSIIEEPTFKTYFSWFIGPPKCTTNRVSLIS